MHYRVRYSLDFDLKIRSGQGCPLVTKTLFQNCVEPSSAAYHRVVASSMGVYVASLFLFEILCPKQTLAYSFFSYEPG